MIHRLPSVVFRVEFDFFSNPLNSPMKITGVKRAASLGFLVFLIVTFFWVRAARQFKPIHQRNASSLCVFAAASLNEAFTQLAEVFEKQNPGLHVELNYAGSQQLALQIEQGARVDVFASADERWMEKIGKHGLLASSAQVFAHNILVVIIPRANPGRIEKLQDLSQPGIKMVLAAESVPAGRYSREVLERLSHSTGFGPDYLLSVLKNLVSSEENVKEVLGKVQLGEADAGMVYYSDITPANAGWLRVLEIPEEANVLASYPIAPLKSASNPQAARKFMDLVFSPLGQSILHDHHFTLVPQPSRSTP
ncbi:MAG: molybdate ABC transporter substrate-binding protein [Acidobacteriia bacterium]|nr:molybdate ABC transporter substrate-binding protein [Terriglobia bacterium]